MSGGSFGYLGNVCDMDDILERRHNLAEMADYLDTLEWAAEAAVDTRQVIAEVQAAMARLWTLAEELKPVWHAIEWWYSGDRSEEHAREACAEYAAKRSPGPRPAAADALTAEARKVLRLLQLALANGGGPS